jgi:threonine dehydrogenase-like Zn-dependent dehydrogenase
MKQGDILGHEFVGEVIEVGADVTTLSVGTRVVVPSIIACGDCLYCAQGQWALCDRSNPNPELQVPLLGYPTCGFYGCSHMYGGFPGSHPTFIRVPFGDVGCFKIPDGLTDVQALFISDAAPTAYLGAELCEIQPGDTVAVWECGAVGLLAQQFAIMMGA